MTYPGNPSLSPDVQKRVLDTFGQTIDLVNEGSRQEALLGCDFVLRMDPQFEPARRLQERLRTSAGAVVDTDDLLGDPAAAGASVVPADLFADFDGLGLDLPDLPAAATADLHAELQDLLGQRRFQDLMALAEREQEAVTADPVLMGIVQEAQTRMEAEPYVRKFLASARAALDAGNGDEAGRILDKVRALDASHPEIAELEAARAPAAADGGFALDGFDLGFDSSGPGFGSLLDEPSAPAFGAGFLDDAAASAASEADPRIRSLLEEGRRAYGGGDLQGAIDAWSRIFLIDIDHAEASRLIEQARKLKAEGERQVEEVFHDGLARVEAGDVEAARQAFQRVVELQPSHFQAREYLQQIESGKTPVVTAPKAPREAPRDTLAGAPESLLLGGDLDVPSDELKEEILVPPDPGEGGAVKTAERRPAKVGRPRERRPSKLFALVGSAVLLLVLAGGWFVWQNWGRFFPNSQPEAAAPAGPDPIALATSLHQSGKIPRAISLLKRLPPSDPHYQQAQELIRQWDRSGTGSPAPPLASGAPAAPAAPPVSPERLAALDSARSAFAEGTYLRASEILEQAATTGKLEPADAELLARAQEQLAPLRSQIEHFRQHEWEYTLRDLWTMREKDPGNRDIARLLVDSYYNLGVRDLQRADTAKAADEFQEALNIAPNDPALRRNLQFAQTYQERQKDLLFKIYVKYLTYR